MSEKYEKLKTLLLELFQLDQPDLDFGLYRIMHAKSGEVTQFLDHDLLPQVKHALGQYRSADRSALEKELQHVMQNARSLDLDPETLPKVRELRAKIADAVDVDALENEVYDHLYSFFRRYYSEGDFLAKRVYKAGVYAIPYEGEEVALHWANKDQYYIKTSEYLKDYAFRLHPESENDPMRVHLRLVDATEGEHGNVKAQEGKERHFILKEDEFIGEEDEELVICFEYRPATIDDWPPEERETKKKPPVQKDLINIAVDRVLGLTDATLKSWIHELAKPHVMANGEPADYSRLEGHLRRYTARHTFDYFIHKDLNGFLRRELDFYIKNEVMHLDDVENETAPKVEQYLSKIKVIRRIAGKVIDFLAQLEGFQKKLWLKKKFVVETSWCITMSAILEIENASVRDTLLSEIIANDVQREEWVRLFAIDDIHEDTVTPGYSVPLTKEFLQAHPTLVVDTRHFGEDFVNLVLAEIDDLNERTDGLLIHSENFQALSLLQERYREQVKCVYIDPPYNTSDRDFAYKDDYRHSSWASMMLDRAVRTRSLLRDNGAFSVQIGDDESANLRVLLDTVWSERKNSVVVRRGIKNVQAQFDNIDRLTLGHDVLHIYTKYPNVRLPLLRQVLGAEKPGKWDTFWRGTNRPTMRYSLFGQLPATGQWRWEENRANRAVENYQYYLENEAETKAIDEWYIENLQSGVNLDFVRLNDEGVIQYFVPPQNTRLVSDNWLDIPVSGNFTEFSHEKSTHLLQRLIGWLTSTGDITLDYFAGSGTTGHAIINLNREDGGERKFILVEMGDYFDTVLLPRIKKVVFTPEWKGGKPSRMATPEEAERSPRMIKVIRLESYEDTLNNLEIKRTESQQSLLDVIDAQGPDGLKEQYLLRYMLDVETRSSQSLLNIDRFADPTAYMLKVKRPGSDESRDVSVDLLETLHYLIGLQVHHLDAPQIIAAESERDTEGRLRLKGSLKEDPSGRWWFRKVTGILRDGRRALIIWRKLTGDIEEDNLVLDSWFLKQRFSTKDSEFDLIYVNGDNNLENLKAPDDTWKVRLIEEEFLRHMFETEGIG